MVTFRISLFGRFKIQSDCIDQVVNIENRKVQELFCFLLIHPHRPHTREALGTLLWEGSSTGQMKKYLRQALWQLQTALEPNSKSSEQRLLLVEAEWVQINPEANYWLDVSSFEQAFNLIRGQVGRSLSAEQVKIVQEAIDLYEGDLLEGWYQDWCLHERERLQTIYLIMLDKMMDFCQMHHRFEEGWHYGNQILAHDQAREHTHRQLMQLFYQSGDRTGALRQYDRCVSILEKELGVKPSKQTIALYQQVCTDILGDAVPTPVNGTASAQGTNNALNGMLGRLKVLKNVLLQLQDQVDEEIKTVEQVLRIEG